MWGQMAGQGMGTGCGYGMAFAMLIRLGVVVWFIVFTVQVLKKLDKIIHLLDKKQEIV